MADWTTIADATLEPGKPWRSVDALAVRDNPIAIAEGATGAPRINPIAAMQHQGVAGAVGTYAMLTPSGAGDAFIYTQGTTIAGSELRYANSASVLTIPGSLVNAGAAPAGTWRLMGYINDQDPDLAQVLAYASMWLRIS